MNENNQAIDGCSIDNQLTENQVAQIEKKDMSKANIWFAVVLGLIAFSVALLPFFYLTNAVVTG